MEGKVVTGILAAAGAVLLGASMVVVTGQDRTPPVIKVGDAELSYTEGDSYDGLLADVTAEDNKDKDITDKVFVDRVITTADGGHAVVIYGVMDSNKNVATTKRTVNYTAQVETDKSLEDESAKEEEAKQEEMEKDTSDKQETAEKSEKEKVAEEAKEEEKKEENTEDKGELVPNGKSPAIRLKANEATIKAGSSFNALSYVENIVDDTDSRDELFKHIHIDGKYNTKSPGTYTMKYYATDKNGNASNIEAFTLTVE